MPSPARFSPFVRAVAAAWLCAGAMAAQAAGAYERVRDQEIAQCLPHEIATWRDGADRPAIASHLRWVYRHDGAPPWFDAATVLAAISRAAEAWSGCGTPSQVAVAMPGMVLGEGAVLVQWSDADSRGNFGLASLGTRKLSLGAFAFQLLNSRNPSYPAGDTLQMVLSHEMGHFLGLMEHSRRCVDVMSYYVGGKGERCFTRDGRSPTGGTDYRALLPTACDIARCRALNRPPMVSQAP